MLAYALLFTFAWQDPAPAPTTAYDPMRLPASATAPPLSLTLHDAARQRELPLRVWLPTATAPAPVVLFSHGLGGSCENNQYLGRHWAARGYAVVFLQHPGSDEAVWRQARTGERMAALQQAASAQNLLLRCGDVKAVLDQLALWNAAADHALCARLDLDHVGMCGHSFGAVTTQAVAGQAMPLLGQKHTDPRIDAALPMSPSGPSRGDGKRAFGKVAVPWLLMTGTKDDSPIGNQSPEDRLAVYPALPATIDRYELVLHDALHSAFSERALPGDTGKRNDNHHRAILALSTAFWDAYLRADGAAKLWLLADGPRGVLEAADRWQCERAVVAGTVR